MVKHHKHRLTVLLLFWSSMMIILYSYLNSRNLESSLLMSYEVMSISSTYFPMSLVFDKVSVSFSALVTFISACVFMFGRSYMSEDPFYYRFMWVLLSFVVSMNMLVYAGSLLWLLVGWDGLGVTSFALIIYYQSSSSLKAGFITLLINRLGDILLMATMFFFSVQGCSLLMNYFESVSFVIVGLFALAALTKSAQYPYSAWLPAAMAAPTPVSALVHSSTLVTAGIYIMIRSCMTMHLSSQVVSLFLFCGSVTSLIGGLCALQENDLKKVIAFSTLSQLGVMVFCLGLNNPYLALLHLYTHAMFKAMLFVVAGYILLLSYGVQDIRLVGRLTVNHPVLLVFLNTSTMCLIGVPFLSAYYSKHAILSLMVSSSVNCLALTLMLVATVLTSVYMIRMLSTLNWGQGGNVLVLKGSFSVWFYLPCILLYLGSLLMGWGAHLVDKSYIRDAFTPTFVTRLVDMLLGVGLVCGLFYHKVGNSSLSSSMFYMDPMWSSMGRANYSCYLHIKSIEYGWVEPYSYVSSLSGGTQKLNSMIQWPSNTFSYLRLVGFSLPVISLWYYLK